MSRRLSLWRRVFWQMREDPWLQGVAVSTLSVALAILGAYLALCLNLYQAGQRLALGPSLILALHQDADPAAAQALAREIARLPEVDRAEYVGRAQALARFRRQLGPNQDLLSGLTDNPLPATMEVLLRPGAADLEALAARFGQNPLVSETVTSRPWLHRLAQTASTLGSLGLALGFLLFAGVVLLVANTVRLAVYVRRNQVEVLDLVGATRAYLRWPFLLETVLQALAGAAAASLMIWGLFSLLAAPAELPLGLNLADLLAFSWLVPPVLAVLAVLAGVLGGLLGLARALRPQELA
ncbi:MAG: permease-like cell division protein FtsX [Pseudomonadota bacterium]